jgi:acyl-CoA synthetase (AMP-forming)/AMP-acid ligase II
VDENAKDITYTELLVQVYQMDACLRKRGVKKGTVVMLVNEIHAFGMIAVMAAIRIGAVFIPNDPKDPPALRTQLIEAAGVAVIMAEEIPDGLPDGVAVVTAAEAAAADGSEAGEPCEFEAQDLAAIFFSSGSTGKPKGVQHCANIWFELIGLHETTAGERIPMGEEMYAKIESGDIELCPVSWSDSLWHGSITWYSNWGPIADWFANKKVVIVSNEVSCPARPTLSFSYSP